MLELLLSLFISHAHAQAVSPPKKPNEVRCHLASVFSASDNPIIGRLASTIQLSDTSGTCSGSLVTLKGRSKSEKALVLTAGHCTGEGKADFGVKAPTAGEVLRNLKIERAFTINTGILAAHRACVGVDELVYATMTDLDIALYQLSESYEEIEQRTAAKPLVISSERTLPAGTKVRAPSGLHENEQTCSIDGVVPTVREFVWTWASVVRPTHECKQISGSSGSPLISEVTNEVVGVVGSVFFESDKPCAVMNPCEVDVAGQTSVAKKGTSYGHFARLASCADALGRFDLNVSGCTLPKP